jgi:hypothetical protein
VYNHIIETKGTDMKDRNKALKALISKAFAPHKVTVRGHRGTSWGWATLSIDYAPRNAREAQELRAKVWELIKAAKIEIGTYGYDDPGSDYGFGSKLHINFAPRREKADSYGSAAWRQHLSAEDWDALIAAEAETA